MCLCVCGCVCVCIRECVLVCVYTYVCVWYTYTKHTHTYSQVLIILAGATQLVSLSIQGCAITDKGLAHLVNLPRLESLELGHHDQGNGQSVTDAGIGSLAVLQSLRSLQLACGHKLLKGLTLPRITQVAAQHVVEKNDQIRIIVYALCEEYVICVMSARSSGPVRDIYSALCPPCVP